MFLIWIFLIGAYPRLPLVSEMVPIGASRALRVKCIW